MPESIKMFFIGTEIMFGFENKQIKRRKSLSTKKELRIAKANMKNTILNRSLKRLQIIKSEALV